MGFEKVFLDPGEKKTVTISLNARSFAYFNVKMKSYLVESGEYEILIGASSKDIRLSRKVTITGLSVASPYTNLKSYRTADVHNIPDDEFVAVLGHDIPLATRDRSLLITPDNTLEHASDKGIGKIMHKIICCVLKQNGNKNQNTHIKMMGNFMLHQPFRTMSQTSRGEITKEFVNSFMAIFNEGFWKWLFSL